jgi:hypothetical protein
VGKEDRKRAMGKESREKRAIDGRDGKQKEGEGNGKMGGKEKDGR